MTLTGAALRAVCERSVGDQARDLSDLVPARFCWPGNNLLHIAGLRLAVDLARPVGQRVTDLTIDGQPVAEARQYRVVTTGFLARGYSGFHWLRDGAERRVVGSERAIVTAALRTSGRLPAPDGRLQLPARLTAPDSTECTPAEGR